MAPWLPINLSGENLGLRHRHLNALVTEAYKQGVPFQEIKDLSEATPVDRLFKIDLASKLRNVDYILQNIKDADMLYVSRALKAKWLLEQKYQDIINPKNLEENLYPYMFTTAVSKFKNWLYLHLKDSHRCEVIYQFYSENNFDYAMKFLGHCNNDFILSEASKVLEKLSPHNFKILCAKCPQIAKVYFDNVPNNDVLKTIFLNKEREFYNSLKIVLKLDADIFFGITEKYFVHKYSRSLTKYIMSNHKDRFDEKPELYAGMLLNMQALAECLSPEECKELVVKLARATYISHIVKYKFVEPLIKRLPKNERAALKKRVFVEKAVGDLIETWPYEKPSLPTIKDYNIHVFHDRQYPRYVRPKPFKRLKITKKCGKRKMPPDYKICEENKPRTLLDQLFDEYRFFSFERTLFELRRRIKEESSSLNRQFMLLVLVSKSGGLPALVASLLQLLEQHSNEPVNVRAAVVRSLVKRAAVWRLPQHSWEAMLQFGQGLGLDGSTPEADCHEGLHAVVIRSLLETGSCEPVIREAFLKEFSLLDEYSTNSDERKILKDKLPELILAAADAESSTSRKVELLTSLFDLLQTYKVDVESSRLIPAVAALHKRDASAAEDLLLRLFRAKIARRTLFPEIFPLIQSDASYLNALRHDTSVLNVSVLVDLIEKDVICPEKFLRKLTIYFAESSGMMHGYLDELKRRVATNPSIRKSIARPLCLLQGVCLGYLQSLVITNKNIAHLAAAIRANMHAGRPKVDIDANVFRTIRAKAIANKVMICPKVEVDQYVQKLLSWRRTIGVALALAERTGAEADVYLIAAPLRPRATLKAALRYFRRRVDFDPRVWQVFLNIMNSFDIGSENNLHLRTYMLKVDNIPPKIKPEYCEVLFKTLKTGYFFDAMSILSYIEEQLVDVKEDFLENIVLDFLQNFHYSCVKKFDRATDMQIRVLVKFLLLCKSEEDQAKRFKTVGEPFLQFLTTLLNRASDRFMHIFEDILFTLQYKKVFFDEIYISPLPVFEYIITWMRQHLPVEKYFPVYVLIHLTMLFFKSIRYSIKSNLDIVFDEKKKITDGILVVGRTFGRKIAQEIKQLQESYFVSAIELYRVGIENYFNDYFDHDVTKYRFIKAVVQGMVEGSVGDEIKAALYLLQEQRSNFDSTDVKELFDALRKVDNDNFQYFLYADLHDNPVF